MKASEYEKIKEMANGLIAFINWKGASFESKKKKIIKEISMIKQYCNSCIYQNHSSNFDDTNHSS